MMESVQNVKDVSEDNMSGITITYTEQPNISTFLKEWVNMINSQETEGGYGKQWCPAMIADEIKTLDDSTYSCKIMDIPDGKLLVVGYNTTTNTSVIIRLDNDNIERARVFVPKRIDRIDVGYDVFAAIHVNGGGDIAKSYDFILLDNDLVIKRDWTNSKFM